MMVDELFNALANVHRRQLLLALLEQNPQDEVPAVDAAHGGETAKEQLKTELFHNHLPMLENRGFIEWDRETSQVTRGPNFEKIRPILESIEEIGI